MKRRTTRLTITLLGVLLLVPVSGLKVQAQVAEQDSLALVMLYNTTDGPNWTNNTNWLTGRVASWAGVGVTSDRVTSLDLGFNQLTGSIPSELTNLTNLTNFLFSNTDLCEPLNEAFQAWIQSISTVRSTGVTCPKPVRIVLPEYTQGAKKKKIRAEVVVEVLVDEKGRVEASKVLERFLLGKDKEDPKQPVDLLGFGLEEAALSAADRWLFRPARKNGTPVRRFHELTFRFGI